MKIDARRLVLMGESAGGALSVRVAQAVRDSDLPAPACVVSWSPWLDVTRSYIGHPHQDVVTPENMERIRACIPQHLHRVRCAACVCAESKVVDVWELGSQLVIYLKSCF